MDFLRSVKVFVLGALLGIIGLSIHRCSNSGVVEQSHNGNLSKLRQVGLRGIRTDDSRLPKRGDREDEQEEEGEEEFVNPDAEIKIVPRDKSKDVKEVISLEVKNYGLSLRPGLHLGVNGSCSGGYGVLGANYQGAFYHRVTLLAGFDFIRYGNSGANGGFWPLVGIGFYPSKRLRNTQFYGAYYPIERGSGFGIRIGL